MPATLCVAPIADLWLVTALVKIGVLNLALRVDASRRTAIAPLADGN